MIKSMTAYAGTAHSNDTHAVKTEIRSYNSRYLDIVLRLPTGYLSVEEKIKELKLIETETHKEINILELELRKMKIKEWEKILIKHG